MTKIILDKPRQIVAADHVAMDKQDLYPVVYFNAFDPDEDEGTYDPNEVIGFAHDEAEAVEVASAYYAGSPFRVTATSLESWYCEGEDANGQMRRLPVDVFMPFLADA